MTYYMVRKDSLDKSRTSKDEVMRRVYLRLADYFYTDTLSNKIHAPPNIGYLSRLTTAKVTSAKVTCSDQKVAENTLEVMTDEFGEDFINELDGGVPCDFGTSKRMPEFLHNLRESLKNDSKADAIIESTGRKRVIDPNITGAALPDGWVLIDHVEKKPAPYAHGKSKRHLYLGRVGHKAPNTFIEHGKLNAYCRMNGSKQRRSYSRSVYRLKRTPTVWRRLVVYFWDTPYFYQFVHSIYSQEVGNLAELALLQNMSHLRDSLERLFISYKISDDDFSQIEVEHLLNLLTTAADGCQKIVEKRTQKKHAPAGISTIRVTSPPNDNLAGGNPVASDIYGLGT